MELVIKTETMQGAEAVVLENDRLRCVCLPEHGGKIASLYRKDKSFELLFQNPRKNYRKAKPGAAFGDYEACGFDDAFPNIDAGRAQTGRGETDYFDHGEIDKALADYNKCIELEPNHVNALANRGAAFGMKQEWEKALNDLNKAIELEPLHSNALSNRAFVWFQMQEYEALDTWYLQHFTLTQPHSRLTV